MIHAKMDVRSDIRKATLTDLVSQSGPHEPLVENNENAKVCLEPDLPTFCDAANVRAVAYNKSVGDRAISTQSSGMQVCLIRSIGAVQLFCPSNEN